MEVKIQYYLNRRSLGIANYTFLSFSEDQGFRRSNDGDGEEGGGGMKNFGNILEGCGIPDRNF